MRIAIPSVQGKLSLHFDHRDQFAIFDIDENLNMTALYLLKNSVAIHR